MSILWLPGCSLSGIVKSLAKKDCDALLADPLIRVPSYEVKPPPPPERKEIRAGVAQVDITPPAGFPMGGSGFTGGFGRGYWTRLYARAFFFQDLDGQSLALVSCEIHSIPGALQAKVAWKLRDEELHPPKNQKNDELHLTRDNLIISATHTHQGPGNYYSAKVFNDQASPAPGFDQKLFDFFVDRIALAVRSAAADARNKTASLRLRETDISGLLRNRAPGPFLLNPESIGFLKHAGCAEPFNETCVRAKAVDGRVTLLEIHHDQKRVGLLVFLAAHPEVMAQATTLYQTDFTGLAMLALEKKHGIVAGFFNGAEGDISADWDKRERNRNEALSFAERLSDQIATALSSGNGNPLENFRFQVASKDLVANPYFDPPFWKGREEYCAVAATAGQPSRRCLSGRPIFGVATVGGAEEGRTTLYDLGWREGWRRPPRGRQGLKVGAFESRILPGLDVTRLIAPVCTYPERFPISLVNIVDPNERSLLSLAVLPAELTFMAGRRIRQSLEKADLNKVTLIGLANDYIDYVTTRQEYAAQAYEGASNIFGPHTADVMEATLVGFVKTPGKLAKPVPRTVKVPSARYYPGTTHDRAEFGPEWLGTAYSDPDEALENLIVDAHDRPYRHWPRFLWCEPSCVGDWTAFQRSVTVRRVDGGTIADDDRGSNILTVHVNRAEGSERDEALTKLRDALMLRPSYAPVPRLKGRKRSWMAIWLPKDPVPGETFVFVVQYSVKDEKGMACEFRYESEPFEANRPMDKALCEKDCDACED